MTERRQVGVVHVPVGLLNLGGAAVFLCVSESTIERFVREGMPALDLGVHHPGRRPKRLLRFDPTELLAWCRQRGRNGSDGR